MKDTLCLVLVKLACSFIVLLSMIKVMLSVQVKQDNTLKYTEMFLFVNIFSFIQIIFLKLNCT